MRRPTLRGLVTALAHRWRASLQLRTVTLAVLLSGIAVLGISLYMAESIRQNLFETRREQLVTISVTATDAAQAQLDAGDETGGSDRDAAARAAFDAVRSTTSSTSAQTDIAIRLIDGQTGQRPAFDLFTPSFDDTLVSAELRAAVTAPDADDQVSAQPVAITGDDGQTAPGLVVATVLTIAQSGRYALYVVYDLSDAQQTLDAVQGTLLAGSLALVVLIGIVTFVVSRLVVAPVRLAAETSEQLAAGRLEQRIPERGDDVLAVLARSFNRMADSMQRQITRLASLSQVQQRFVSDVSHELRTPLTTIRLAGDVLYEQREEFPPASRRTAELLRTQVERFDSLLADLLEMSRYDAGAVQLDIEGTNLVRLVEDELEAYRPLADERGSELRLVAPGGHFALDVDARRIRRIVTNLLGNAIDHGEGRPIVVVVDSDADAVAIAVRDYGVGMPAAALAHVFERFWRADPSRQRRTGGTGLGLAISLEDAALHGGRLEVWSDEGHGSCFRLTLPRRAGEQVTSSPIALPPDDDALTRVGANREEEPDA